MPQNTDANSNTDAIGAAEPVTGSTALLNEPPDPPDQNDTRNVEFGQSGDEIANSEAQEVEITTTTTTTTTTTSIDNSNETSNLTIRDLHAKERNAKRKAIGYNDAVDAKFTEVHDEIVHDEILINEIVTRIGADETRIGTDETKIETNKTNIQKLYGMVTKYQEMNDARFQKLNNEFAGMKKLLADLVQEKIEDAREKAELTSQVRHLTIKSNDYERRLKIYEQPGQEHLSYAQAANSMNRKIEILANNQKKLAEKDKLKSQVIAMNMDQNKVMQKQINSVKKSITDVYRPSVPTPQQSLAQIPCITISPSERLEAIKAENRTDREVKKIIDKEIAPSIVAGVNFTDKGNLSLRIKDISSETMTKLKTFGNIIDNETWHKVIIDGVQKGDLIEDGELINAEELKSEIENSNGVTLACAPHAIRTEALKSNQTSCFSLVVAFRDEYLCRETLKRGMYFINQHCRARKWLPKPPTTMTKPNVQNKLTDVMEVDSTEQIQPNVNNDQ